MSASNIQVTIMVDGIVKDKIKEQFKGMFIAYLCSALHIDSEETAIEWFITEGAQYRGIPEHQFKDQMDAFWSNY